MNQDEFYENIPGWISKEKSSWNHITLMAYFCHKYMTKHGVRFRLVRWKGDPGKGKESRDFAKLIKILSPDDYESLEPSSKARVKQDIVLKVYNYINWMFDYKFRRGERSVTGTGLFLMPSMINEFERMYSKHTSKERRSNSLDSLLSWARSNLPEVLDRHQLETPSDLKMIEAYIKTYSLPEGSPEAVLVGKAQELKVI